MCGKGIPLLLPHSQDAIMCQADLCQPHTQPSLPSSITPYQMWGALAHGTKTGEMEFWRFNARISVLQALSEILCRNSTGYSGQADAQTCKNLDPQRGRSYRKYFPLKIYNKCDREETISNIKSWFSLSYKKKVRPERKLENDINQHSIFKNCKWPLCYDMKSMFGVSEMVWFNEMSEVSLAARTHLFNHAAFSSNLPSQNLV